VLRRVAAEAMADGTEDHRRCPLLIVAPIAVEMDGLGCGVIGRPATSSSAAAGVIRDDDMGSRSLVEVD
jgi:hypothetical protein